MSIDPEELDNKIDLARTETYIGCLFQVQELMRKFREKHKTLEGFDKVIEQLFNNCLETHVYCIQQEQPFLFNIELAKLKI